jgi:hypothetical protein
MRAISTMTRGIVAIWVIMLLLGLTIGRLTVGGHGIEAAGASPTIGGTDSAQATQTAEHTELDRLRTQVAQTPSPAVCAPPPTSTPTPSSTPTVVPTLVPPVAEGQPLPYAGNWTVAVDDVSLLPNFADLTPQGIYAKVSLTITNNSSVAHAFPYGDLDLRDVQGRTFVTPVEVKTLNEAGWFSPFPPNLPTEGFIIFDIATDATGPFILESTKDPTFRVQIELQARG